MPRIRPVAAEKAHPESRSYCTSAHTAVGRRAGLTAAELARNLHVEATDPRVQAALDLARALVARRGRIGDGELAAACAAGLGEPETVASVAENVFTNYFNLVAQADIDFPVVVLPEPARA